jgi:hypothetical protein
MNTNIFVNPTANHATIDRFENVNIWIAPTNGDPISYASVNVDIIDGETINVYQRAEIITPERCIHCFIAGSYSTIEIF